MYYLTYFADFKDNDNNSLRLDIYTQISSVTASEIKLTHDDSITISYSTESVFSPLHTSRATINIFTTDLLTKLYSGGLFGTLVHIYKNSTLYWAGYATPCVYTQSYVGKWDTLTLECIDFVSQLSNVAYTKLTSDNVGIASFFAVITHCLAQVDTNHIITSLLIDQSVTIDTVNDAISNVYIRERNFFDEKKQAEQCSDVVSSILQYLGLTLCQWGSAYYIYRQSVLLHTTYLFTQYYYNGSVWQAGGSIVKTFSPRSFAQIGLSRADTTISLDGVYNKVSIVASNNPLDGILPDFDDSDDLVNQHSQDTYFTESYTDPSDKTHTLVSGFFKSQSNWSYNQPTASGTTISAVTAANRDTITGGTFWQQCDSYSDNVPSSLSWTNYLTFSGSEWYFTSTPYISLANTQSLILDGGYLIINITYRLSTNNAAHSVVKSMYDSATFGTCSSLTWTDDSDAIGGGNWPCDTLFPCRVTIGNYYYNGEQFVSYTDFNARVNRGYYNFDSTNIHGYAIQGGDNSVHKEGDWENWYRYKNTNGDWIYCTQSEYNASSAQKETGKTLDNHHVWFVNGNNEHVAVCIDYYHEMLTRDKFYLAHINKTSDCIYDTDYKLTNTVSYAMRLADATDGVALKCPTNQVLFGALNFELYAPCTSASYASLLGRNPQWRSDNASTTCRACHISALSIDYRKTNDTKSIFDSTESQKDAIYTNVVNDSYCTAMDDLELRVNTTNGYTSHSYAISSTTNGYDYIKTLYFDGVSAKPEQHLINALVSHYRYPRYRLSRTLINDNVCPMQPITEQINDSSRLLIATETEYNLSSDRVRLTADEVDNNLNLQTIDTYDVAHIARNRFMHTTQ